MCEQNSVFSNVCTYSMDANLDANWRLQLDK